MNRERAYRCGILSTITLTVSARPVAHTAANNAVVGIPVRNELPRPYAQRRLMMAIAHVICRRATPDGKSSHRLSNLFDRILVVFTGLPIRAV